MQAVNSVVHTTVGTVERFSDGMICCAESVLKDDDAAAYKKVAAAAVVVPYAAVKYSAAGVKNVADFVVGGLLKMFE